MKDLMMESIIKEGIDVLYNNLGAIKAIKFLQLVSVSKGDTVQEIESITETMSKEEVLKMVSNAKEANEELWKKVKLI